MTKQNQKENLSRAARDARNAYLREWRAKNKDKVRQHQTNFWEKKAKEMMDQE